MQTAAQDAGYSEGPSLEGTCTAQPLDDLHEG
jgi:hypothetical protein